MKRAIDSKPSVHIQGWQDMPKETQDALVRMFQIIADNWKNGTPVNKPTEDTGDDLRGKPWGG